MGKAATTWCLHNSVIPSIVWCMPYARGVRHGRRLGNGRVIVLQKCGQCRWGVNNKRMIDPCKPRRGRWHAPSSRHLRALLSVCGGCLFEGLGCCSCRVCVSVSGGVVLCRCVCVCV